jgi:hypothetical protein
MSKLLSAAVGAAIVVLAFVLNPTPEKHRAKRCGSARLNTIQAEISGSAAV